MHGMKHLYLQLYQDASSRTYTMPINLAFSIKDFPRKPCTWKTRNVVAVNTVKFVSQNINLRCDVIINIGLVWSIWANHQKLFGNNGILEKSPKEVINDQTDLSKDVAVEELEVTINEFRERLPDEVIEELNAAVLLDINAELSTNRDKPSDA